MSERRWNISYESVGDHNAWLVSGPREIDLDGVEVIEISAYHEIARLSHEWRSRAEKAELLLASVRLDRDSWKHKCQQDNAYLLEKIKRLEGQNPSSHDEHSRPESRDQDAQG